MRSKCTYVAGKRHGTYVGDSQHACKQHLRTKVTAQWATRHASALTRRSTPLFMHVLKTLVRSKKFYVGCNLTKHYRRIRVRSLTWVVVATKLQSTECNAPIRDRSKILLIISIVIGVTALVAVCMRMYVAARQGSFGWDDVTCLAAYAASVPVTVVCCVTSVHGFGKDTWASPVEDIFLTLRVCC